MSNIFLQTERKVEKSDDDLFYFDDDSDVEQNNSKCCFSDEENNRCFDNRTSVSTSFQLDYFIFDLFEVYKIISLGKWNR